MHKHTLLFKDRLVLMNEDWEVGYFENGYLEIIPGREYLAPLCFSHSHWPLSKWAEVRLIDDTRPNAKQLKEFFELEDASAEEVLLSCHAVCLTDSYWIRRESENLSWILVKPNSDILAETAIFGADPVPIIPGIISPELTNTGSYEKAWMFDSGKWYLVKRGTLEECFTELLIPSIADLLSFDCVQYVIDLEENTVLCEDFTQGKLNFEPMSYIVDDDIDYEKSYTWLELQGKTLAKSYLDMLFLDALIGNPDRHTNNYGLLRDRKSGEVLRMAPIYDNHLALIASKCQASTSLISEFKLFIKDIPGVWEPPVLNKQELHDAIWSICEVCGFDADVIVERVWSNYLKLIG